MIKNINHPLRGRRPQNSKLVRDFYFKMSNYSERLKRPEWQEKRLLILNRDKFTCQHCLVYGETVNVHHLYYTPNTEPWDYPNKALLTLCDECHSWEHEIEEFAQETFFRHFKAAGFSNRALLTISEGFMDMVDLPASENLVAHSIMRMLKNKEELNSMHENFKS